MRGGMRGRRCRGGGGRMSCRREDGAVLHGVLVCVCVCMTMVGSWYLEVLVFALHGLGV